MSYLDYIVSLAEKWKGLGEKTLENGTRLIGHVPQVAPQAYLHQFYLPALTGGEFEVVELFVKRPLPQPLRELYGRFNGLRLFQGELGVDGLRRSSGRTVEDVWQPFAIQTPNADERPERAPDDFVFFGGYKDDLTLLGMRPASPEIIATKPERWRVKATWPDLESCLVSEAERLSRMFNDAGDFVGKRGRVSPGA